MKRTVSAILLLLLSVGWSVGRAVESGEVDSSLFSRLVSSSEMRYSFAYAVYLYESGSPYLAVEKSVNLIRDGLPAVAGAFALSVVFEVGDEFPELEAALEEAGESELLAVYRSYIRGKRCEGPSASENFYGYVQGLKWCGDSRSVAKNLVEAVRHGGAEEISRLGWGEFFRLTEGVKLRCSPSVLASVGDDGDGLAFLLERCRFTSDGGLLTYYEAKKQYLCGNLRSAALYFRRMSAKTVSYDYLASSYAYLGRIYWRLGRRRTSADWFKKSANRVPTSEAYYYVGSYYLNAGNEDRAVLYFRRAIEVGERGEKYHDRAAFYLFRHYLVRGYPSLALKYLQEYEDGRPEKVFWFWKLGALEKGEASEVLELYPNSYYYSWAYGGDLSRYLKGYFPRRSAPDDRTRNLVKELDFLKDEGFAETGLRVLSVMRGAGFFSGDERAFYYYFRCAFDSDLGRYAAAIKNGFEVLNEPKYLSLLTPEQRKEVWSCSYPTPYLSIFTKYGKKYGFRTRFLLAVVHQESRFQADALSPAGAVGLMQLLPSTARQISRKVGRKYWKSRLTDPDYNVNLGVYYLDYLMRRYDKDLLKTLVAYNAGPELCKRWSEEHGDRLRRKGLERVESVYPTETRLYVKRILHNIKVYTIVLRSE